MGGIKEVNFSAFVSNLSPCAFACFKVLFDTARDKIVQDGPQGEYEAPLAQLLEDGAIGDVEAIANSIREIIQCRVDVKKGEYRYFYPFLSSVRIEGGIIKYGMFQEIESLLPKFPLPDSV
jgi:hypothetical protein